MGSSVRQMARHLQNTPLRHYVHKVKSPHSTTYFNSFQLKSINQIYLDLVWFIRLDLAAGPQERSRYRRNTYNLYDLWIGRTNIEV